LLTGAPVFGGDSVVEVLAKHLHELPEPLADRAKQPIPAALERVVLACLAKKPEERPASARAVRDELLAVVSEGLDVDLATWWQQRRDHVATAAATAVTAAMTRTFVPRREDAA
jgi:serine/threonine-protein kinase